MTADSFENSGSRPAKRRRRSARSVLLAGVASACVMGVGVGMWARPTTSERGMHAAAPGQAFTAPTPPHRLQIVVDDHLTIRTPIEVLSVAPPAPPRVTLTPPASTPEPVAPMRPPEDLVRVQAVDAPSPSPSPAKFAAKAKVAPAQAPDPPRQMMAKGTSAPKTELARTNLARAHAAHKPQLARADAAHKAEVAHKAELARAATAHRVELAKAAKASTASRPPRQRPTRSNSPAPRKPASRNELRLGQGGGGAGQGRTVGPG